MILAEVIGSVVCTIRIDPIKNAKLKLVKLLKPNNDWAGSYSIVEDSIGSGVGEKVLIADDEISVGQMLDGRKNVPLRFCIVARVESINLIK